MKLIQISFDKKKPKKGFTLVETMVSIFVFALAMVMIMGSFSSFLKSYISAKRTQRNLENAEFAMNLMAKTLRTSAIAATTNAFPLNTYDYTQNLCIKYDINSSKLKRGTALPSTDYDPGTCNFAAIVTNNAAADLTDAIISKAAVAAIPSTSNNYGYVTISLEVGSLGSTFARVPIEMTVSLRNDGTSTAPSVAGFACQALPANSTACGSTGLTQDRNYQVISGSCSGSTDVCEATCSAGYLKSGNTCVAAGDTTAPTVPANLVATAASSSQINLTWNASTDAVGVTGYNIYRCQGAGCTPTVNIGTSNTNSYSNSGLPASTTYVYKVDAYDAANNISAKSASASANTLAAPDTTAPSVPTSLLAYANSHSSAMLSWAASTDNVAVTGYKIYRNGVQIATTAGTSYTNNGLADNQTYNYTIAAYDAAGNSSSQTAQKSVALASTSCLTSDSTLFGGVCGMGKAVLLPNGCNYDRTEQRPPGVNEIFSERCVNGVWVNDGGDGGGGGPPWYDDWSDGCGDNSAKYISC